MTRDQMFNEHKRLQTALEAHDARTVEGAVPEPRDGLRKRIAALAEKLAETDRA
jgi:hypothetical protein